MIRLGVRLAVRSGREALVRLAVITAAVGIGVGLLLSVLAIYQGYQASVAKPCWQCTNPAPDTTSGSLLWNFSEDMYQGRSIDRLDVATLAAGVPVVPGLAAMPAAGQYYASPALARLLARVPADELADRYPGTLAGTIGPAGLQSPDSLAIVIGYPPDTLRALPGTGSVSAIQLAPHGLSTSQFYKFGFALGAVALLIPMVVLIGTATRMAAARREERYAAMRLVGATSGQINVIASVDAVLGALLGAAVGIGVYAALHPALVNLKLLGYRFFAADITPTGAGYAIMLIGVPVMAAIACLSSLRRVRISPLGVTRRVTPPPPRFWRAIPLAVGLVLFVAPLRQNPQATRNSPGLAVLSMALVMIGMMIAGPWLTAVAAKASHRYARGGAGLLAAGRLSDNPRAAYRAVSGLVLAVLVGTMLAAIVPAAIANQSTTADASIAQALRVGFLAGDCKRVRCDPQDSSTPHGLSPDEAAALVEKITAAGGTAVAPFYYDGPAGPDSPAAVSCADLAKIPAFGACPAGATAVRGAVFAMFTDNIAAMNRILPFFGPDSEPASGDITQGGLAALVVYANAPAALERVRTVLSGYPGAIDRDAYPQTFGEVAQTRADLYLEVQRAVILLAAVTLLIAGISLAVAISGSLVERRRPFTLLRVSGTPIQALYRTVLLETILPLVTATLVAAGVGLLLAYPVARALAPQRHAPTLPAGSYYVTLGASLAIALAIIVACLPILGRITRAEQARFE
jgi:hypothetical protein